MDQSTLEREREGGGGGGGGGGDAAYHVSFTGGDHFGSYPKHVLVLV